MMMGIVLREKEWEDSNLRACNVEHSDIGVCCRASPCVTFKKYMYNFSAVAKSWLEERCWKETLLLLWVSQRTAGFSYHRSINSCPTCLLMNGDRGCEQLLSTINEVAYYKTIAWIATQIVIQQCNTTSDLLEEFMFLVYCISKSS